MTNSERKQSFFRDRTSRVNDLKIDEKKKRGYPTSLHHYGTSKANILAVGSVHVNNNNLTTVDILIHPSITEGRNEDIQLKGQLGGSKTKNLYTSINSSGKNLFQEEIVKVKRKGNSSMASPEGRLNIPHDNDFQIGKSESAFETHY